MYVFGALTAANATIPQLATSSIAGALAAVRAPKTSQRAALGFEHIVSASSTFARGRTLHSQRTSAPVSVCQRSLFQLLQ